MFPEMNDKNIVNPVEDVRAGLPDKSGETYVCYNYFIGRMYNLLSRLDY